MFSERFVKNYIFVCYTEKIMSEMSPEHEPQPRITTGIFQLRAERYPVERDENGKVKPAGGEPIFAVKDLTFPYTREAWKELALRFVDELEGEEKEYFDVENVSSVSIGPWPSLTDNMDTDTIRRVSDDEYRAAHHERYGDAIYIPTFW